MNLALFDLDGTIADSGPTIIGSVRVALERLGHPVPAEAQLRGFVGPPLMQAITGVLGIPAAEADAFRTLFRSIYVERMTEASAYPGVEELVVALRSEGWVLGVASSKREDLVQRILQARGLDEHFTVMAGAGLDEKNAAKGWVIGRAMSLFAEAGVDPGNNGIMVGDRVHDVAGAAEHGMRSVFVRWGYGSAAEEVGADAVVDTPQQLGAVLRRLAQHTAQTEPSPAL